MKDPYDAAAAEISTNWDLLAYPLTRRAELAAIIREHLGDVLRQRDSLVKACKTALEMDGATQSGLLPTGLKGMFHDALALCEPQKKRPWTADEILRNES